MKAKGQWIYLYHAVDSEGNTIDFYLSESRDKQAVKRFFKKTMAASHICKPRAITADKNPAIQKLKEEKRMPEGIQIRQVKYLNNIVEQDHRFIKKRVRSMLGFKSYETATSILCRVEGMHMMKKDNFPPQMKLNSYISCSELYHNLLLNRPCRFYISIKCFLY